MASFSSKLDNSSFPLPRVLLTLSDGNCLTGDVWQLAKPYLSVRSVASASWRIGNVFIWNGVV